MRIRALAGFGLMLLAVWAPVRAHASAYPPRVDPVINDLADLLTPDQEGELRAIVSAERARSGVDAAVLTIDKRKMYDPDSGSIEAFATDLFDAWGIGDATRNDGMLLVVARDDRDVRIELGAKWGESVNGAMAEIVQSRIVPRFREGDYATGIIDGMRAALTRLGTGATTAEPRAPAAGADDGDDGGGDGGGGGGAVPWVVGGVAGGGGVLGVGGRMLWRRRPRKCNECGTKMAMLDEVGDDVYLESGQKVEEFLKAVDYDVWKCPSCGDHDLYRYPSLVSKKKKCPSCSFKTVARTKTVLESPTYVSSGRARVDRNCAHCKFHDDEIVVLPKKTRSASSSSSSGSSRSSFSSGGGGGRSGGGGASGKW